MPGIQPTRRQFLASLFASAGVIASPVQSAQIANMLAKDVLGTFVTQKNAFGAYEFLSLHLHESWCNAQAYAYGLIVDNTKNLGQYLRQQGLEDDISRLLPKLEEYFALEQQQIYVRDHTHPEADEILKSLKSSLDKIGVMLKLPDPGVLIREYFYSDEAYFNRSVMRGAIQKYTGPLQNNPEAMIEAPSAPRFSIETAEGPSTLRSDFTKPVEDVIDAQTYSDEDEALSIPEEEGKGKEEFVGVAVDTRPEAPALTI